MRTGGRRSEAPDRGPNPHLRVGRPRSLTSAPHGPADRHAGDQPPAGDAHPRHLRPPARRAPRATPHPFGRPARRHYGPGGRGRHQRRIAGGTRPPPDPRSRGALPRREVRPVRGLVPHLLAARAQGTTTLLVPGSQVSEAMGLGVSVVPIRLVDDLVDFIFDGSASPVSPREAARSRSVLLRHLARVANEPRSPRICCRLRGFILVSTPPSILVGVEARTTRSWTETPSRLSYVDLPTTPE